MSSKQATLDGDVVEHYWHVPKNGAALVLWYAPPDTEWARMREWYDRLEAEGLL